MKVGFIKVAMPVRGALVVPELDGGKLTATGVTVDQRDVFQGTGEKIHRPAGPQVGDTTADLPAGRASGRT